LERRTKNHGNLQQIKVKTKNLRDRSKPAHTVPNIRNPRSHNQIQQRAATVRRDPVCDKIGLPKYFGQR